MVGVSHPAAKALHAHFVLHQDRGRKMMAGMVERVLRFPSTSTRPLPTDTLLTRAQVGWEWGVVIFGGRGALLSARMNVWAHVGVFVDGV